MRRPSMAIWRQRTLIYLGRAAGRCGSRAGWGAPVSAPVISVIAISASILSMPSPPLLPAENELVMRR